MAKLRTLAIDMMADRIKEILRSHLQRMNEDERRDSMIEMVRQEVNHFAELRLTQRDVVEWSASPQGTVTDLLGNLPPARQEQLMSIVDFALNPIAQTLTAEISVAADWDADPKISHIIVTVEYPNSSVDRVKQVRLDKTKDKGNASLAAGRRRQRGIVL